MPTTSCFSTSVMSPPWRCSSRAVTGRAQRVGHVEWRYAKVVGGDRVDVGATLQEQPRQARHILDVRRVADYREVQRRQAVLLRGVTGAP